MPAVLRIGGEEFPAAEEVSRWHLYALMDDYLHGNEAWKMAGIHRFTRVAVDPQHLARFDAFMLESDFDLEEIDAAVGEFLKELAGMGKDADSGPSSDGSGKTKAQSRRVSLSKGTSGPVTAPESSTG